jgi:hypothetical protein
MYSRAKKVPMASPVSRNVFNAARGLDRSGGFKTALGLDWTGGLTACSVSCPQATAVSRQHAKSDRKHRAAPVKLRGTRLLLISKNCISVARMKAICGPLRFL